MIVAMPKKIAKMDGRNRRYTPITRQELKQMADRIGKCVGKMLEAVDEMESLNIGSFIVDGRQAVDEAIEKIVETTKAASACISTAKLDL